MNVGGNLLRGKRLRAVASRTHDSQFNRIYITGSAVMSARIPPRPQRLQQQLLALTRLLQHVVVRKAQHPPAVQQKMVLTHKVIGELTAVQVAAVRAVSVRLQVDAQTVRADGVVEKSRAYSATNPSK